MKLGFALLAVFVAACAATEQGPLVPDAPTPPDARIDAPLPPDAPIDAPVDAPPDAQVFDACVPTGLDEICNGLDDDCNGTVDDEWDVGDTCTAGLGVCMRVGEIVCEGDAGVATCSVMGAEPESPEICGNDADDDCDGETDEGFEMLGNQCITGQGICERQGLYVCSEDRLQLACSATPGTPAPAELCGNGLDDDCDGMEDEGFELLGTGCTVGVGACERPGIFACTTDRLQLVCNATPGIPNDNELCGNNIDDDCDGQVDEGFSTVGELCDGEDVDLCNEGTIVCDPDLLGVSCSDTTGNNPDVCNAFDDDCDPLTPDGAHDPSSGAVCDSTVDGDQCLEGNLSCQGGFMVCSDPGNDDTSNDPQNCGNCGIVCTNPHGTVGCAGGACNPTCIQGYQSCDADLNDGCEASRWSGAGCWTEDWGALDGDTDGDSITKTGFEETWAIALVREDSSLPDDLNVRVTLTNPPGARFGMRVRCKQCPHLQPNFRQVEPGEDDSGFVYMGAGDDTGPDDDFYIVIEVYFISNTSRTCNLTNDRWEVQIQQTESVSERNCN